MILGNDTLQYLDEKKDAEASFFITALANYTPQPMVRIRS
jgi:hypothetical protein